MRRFRSAALSVFVLAAVPMAGPPVAAADADVTVVVNAGAGLEKVDELAIG